MSLFSSANIAFVFVLSIQINIFANEIVGGVQATKNEFPFMVSVQNQNGEHFCGGSLIKKNWVLTAAHCIEGEENLKIVVGLNNQKDLSTAETFTSKRLIMHPQYNPATTDYDYALIELSGESRIKPVLLNESEIHIDESHSILATAAGWGVLSSDSSRIPNHLYKVNLPLVSTRKCNSPSANAGQVTDRMICAGYDQGGKDTCQSDSGGPLFLRKANGETLQIGIVSWGNGCGEPRQYGVYAKVNATIDWIKSIITSQKVEKIEAIDWSDYIETNCHSTNKDYADVAISKDLKDASMSWTVAGGKSQLAEGKLQHDDLLKVYYFFFDSNRFVIEDNITNGVGTKSLAKLSFANGKAINFTCQIFDRD